MLTKQPIESANLFHHIAPNSLESIRQSVKKYLFKKGALVIEHCCTKNNFLYIVSGLAKLFKSTPNGDEIILDVLSNGQYCGEQFIFQDKEDTYAIQALSDLDILTLPLNAMLALP